MFADATTPFRLLFFMFFPFCDVKACVNTYWFVFKVQFARLERYLQLVNFKGRNL